MIWGFVFTLLGLFTFGWGLNTFNDPSCASARISLKYRSGEIICYPTGSVPDGPIPGNLLAFGIMAVGLLILAISVDSISDSRKQRILKNKSYVSALEILGSVKGQSKAVHEFSGTEGSLMWSTERFVFLPDEPLAGSSSVIGPIAFNMVEAPSFRLSVFSTKGYLLDIPILDGSTLAFTSESGKIKNLKKEIDRFKNANPS
jgi:hypothetical protein